MGIGSLTLPGNSEKLLNVCFRVYSLRGHSWGIYTTSFGHCLRITPRGVHSLVFWMAGPIGREDTSRKESDGGMHTGGSQDGMLHSGRSCRNVDGAPYVFAIPVYEIFFFKKQKSIGGFLYSFFFM